MKFRSLKNFSSSRWGNVRAGDMIELDKNIASQMVKAGFVELPEGVAQQLRDKALADEKAKAKK